MPKVIVVGAGAGGCMAARELARTCEVVLLEQGRAFKPFSVNAHALEPLRRSGLLFDERMIQLLFPAMRVTKAKRGLVHVHGASLGGTTALATSNAFRCDEALRDIGINLDAEFEELGREVPQTTAHRRRWSTRTEELFEAFEALSLAPEVSPKMLVDDARTCVACGRCVLGCPTGAKWTADRLLDGVAGVEVRSGCEVLALDFGADTFAGEPKRAAGVRFRERGREGVLRADAVVLAAGGLGTPAVLSRSGIQSTPTLFVDPVLCVAGPLPGCGLDRQLPMPFVSRRDGYLLAPYFDWLSYCFDKRWRLPASDIASVMIKLADDSFGYYDGSSLSKVLTVRDEETLRGAVEKCKLILERVGVRREDMFLGTLNAGHPGGCVALTADDSSSLHPRPLPSNVYIADSSLLPRSLGAPPILTIMALAKRVARVVRETLR